MLDLFVLNAKIHNKKELMQIGCCGGKILEVAPKIEPEAQKIIDANGYFVTPPFIDSHLHLDGTLSMGMELLTTALDKGVDVIGGIPHFERTMAEAGMNCICNPLVNMIIQGRHDTYPKRRGLMRVPELLDAGNPGNYESGFRG